MSQIKTIIIKPILTEKMLAAQDDQNKYAFKVAPDANKIEIKKAVEHKFDVSVKDVKTINVKGKSKRMNTRKGLTSGKRAGWKKALVTLKEGHNIDFFEGQQG
jgi:large subunit ribosomal protein L23